MQIQETHVTEGSKLVSLVIADSDNLEEAKEIVRIQVLTEFEHDWHLPAIQRAALHRLRDVIGDEIRRTGNILNRLAE